MSLNEHIHKFIQKESLLSRDTKILLAVSGGVDSMVLLNLMNGFRISLGVGHVNYKLRTQSDKEEELVKEYCDEREIEIHPYVLSEVQIEALRKGNLQDKARKIRYNFFGTVMKEFSYTHIMTAHHLDDRIEGLFLGLLRSSGLHGLSGMEASEGNLLRPLLNISKEDILAYAKINGVPFLHDKTNFASFYDRNFIRNETLPKLKSRFPDYQKSIKKSLENLNDTRELLDYFIKSETIKYVRIMRNEIIIDHLERIKSMPGASTFLYLLVKKFNFNRADVSDMIKAYKVGAQFASKSHRAVLDRDRIVIRKKTEREKASFHINKFGIHKFRDNQSISMELVDSFDQEKGESCEYFDGDKISFPIEIRYWQAGDRFCPLGMNGKSKKVKYFLTDLKISRLEKEEVKVAVSEDEIVWVIGYRMDDRFKVTPQTSRILKMEVCSEEED